MDFNVNTYETDNKFDTVSPQSDERIDPGGCGGCAVCCVFCCSDGN